MRAHVANGLFAIQRPIAIFRAVGSTFLPTGAGALGRALDGGLAFPGLLRLVANFVVLSPSYPLPVLAALLDSFSWP